MNIWHGVQKVISRICIFLLLYTFWSIDRKKKSEGNIKIPRKKFLRSLEVVFDMRERIKVKTDKMETHLPKELLHSKRCTHVMDVYADDILLVSMSYYTKYRGRPCCTLKKNRAINSTFVSWTDSYIIMCIILLHLCINAFISSDPVKAGSASIFAFSVQRSSPVCKRKNKKTTTKKSGCKIPSHGQI